MLLFPQLLVAQRVQLFLQPLVLLLAVDSLRYVLFVVQLCRRVVSQLALKALECCDACLCGGSGRPLIAAHLRVIIDQPN